MTATMQSTATSATPDARSRSPRRADRGLLSRLNALTGFVLLIVAWELVARVGLIDPHVFAPLSEIVLRLGQLATTLEFWGMMMSTVRTWALGLAIAVVGGFVLGLLIGLIPGARAFTHSTIEFLRPIPSVALVPAVILLVGGGFQSGLILITYAALWPMLLQTLAGLDDVDPVARETARSFRFGRWMTVTDLVLPSVLPHLFTGFRISASIALVLAVTSEMVIGTFGLGQGIALAQSAADTTKMYGLVIVAGLLGVAVNLGTRTLEKRALRWHATVRNAEAA
ncbi:MULTISPECIES: ABC transporter permease [unclassified Microbacterium]|uniref:ABC transporter permease n=1 Tax=unclassified Microbacterium TaxID=2609290 RepID=UPI0030174126